jgi:anaerobic selenocysteine-containing dehydrogenase
VQGEQAVTVYPHDAAERGITDGTYVCVFNDRGQFIAQARVTDEIASGVAMAPMGAWRKNAKGHSTVNAVNPCAKLFGIRPVRGQCLRGAEPQLVQPEIVKRPDHR